MRPVRVVVLDNEAVQALVDPGHAKHRRALAIVAAVAARNDRRAGTVRLLVPTAVRVEAGWDRRSPRAAFVNRLRADDAVLDNQSADLAAAVRADLRVSVADAHLAACLVQRAGPFAVVTSDVDDVRAIAERSGAEVTVVAL